MPPPPKKKDIEKKDIEKKDIVPHSDGGVPSDGERRVFRIEETLQMMVGGGGIVSNLNATDIRTLQEKFEKLKEQGNADASQIKDLNREVDELKAALKEEKKKHLITQEKLETTLATVQQLQTEIQKLKLDIDQFNLEKTEQASRITLLEEGINAQKQQLIIRQCAMDVELRVMQKIWPQCRKKPYHLRSLRQLCDLVLTDSASTLNKQSNAAWGNLEEVAKSGIRTRFADVQKDLDLEELSQAIKDTKGGSALAIAHPKCTSDQLTKAEQWAVAELAEEPRSAFTTVRKAWSVLTDHEA